MKRELRVDPENMWLNRYANLVKFLWRKGGYKGFFVYGEQGSGKTTFALHLLRKIYDNSWEQALRHTFFTPHELQPVLDQVIDRVTSSPGEPTLRLRGLMIDDAGVFFSAYKFYEDVEFTYNVQKLMQLIRRASACLVLTATDIEEVLRPLRRQKWVFVDLGYSYWYRNLQVTFVNMYTVKKLPTGRKYTKKMVENMPFVVYLPDKVREKYEKMQKMYLKKADIDLVHKKREKDGEDVDSQG